jgi:hypothetical protein
VAGNIVVYFNVTWVIQECTSAFIGSLFISDFGKESSVSLANLKAEEVLKQVERLSKSY